MAQTANCGSCASDFGRTGATCEHCKREAPLLEWQHALTASASTAVDDDVTFWRDAPAALALRRLQRWLSGARAAALWRGGGGSAPGTPDEAELALLRAEAEADVAAWGVHRAMAQDKAYGERAFDLHAGAAARREARARRGRTEPRGGRPRPPRALLDLRQRRCSD